MERDTLIKVFALLLIVAFMLELFSMRSSVTSTSVTNNTVENKTTSLYGTGQALVTLASYKEYLNVFKTGKDITTNSSLNELRNIDGVGYINRRGGGLILVLDQGANAPLIASEVKQRFPDLNITAVGQFYLPPNVEFTTSQGIKNVSMNAVIEIEMQPDILPGDNVTLSLIGLVSGDSLDGAPLAKIIPTQGEALVNATIKDLTDEYAAIAMIPWESRNANVSGINDSLSEEVQNLSINYTPRSYIMIAGLDSSEDAVINKIKNISYVGVVDGNLIGVSSSMNDSGKIDSDMKGSLGNNTTVSYPTSIMEITFRSANLSKDIVSSKVGWNLTVYRRAVIDVGVKINISGVEYAVSTNTTFDEMLLDNYSVGQKIGALVGTGTIGRKIVNLEILSVG